MRGRLMLSDIMFVGRIGLPMEAKGVRPNFGNDPSTLSGIVKGADGLVLPIRPLSPRFPVLNLPSPAALRHQVLSARDGETRIMSMR